jgi:hypothetical protein
MQAPVHCCWLWTRQQTPSQTMLRSGVPASNREQPAQQRCQRVKRPGRVSPTWITWGPRPDDEQDSVSHWAVVAVNYRSEHRLQARAEGYPKPKQKVPCVGKELLRRPCTVSVCSVHAPLMHQWHDGSITQLSPQKRLALHSDDEADIVASGAKTPG